MSEPHTENPDHPDHPNHADHPDNRLSPDADAAVLAQSRRHTRRSFAVAAAASAAGYGLYRWSQSTAHSVEMQPPALREAMLVNERISRAVLPTHLALAPTYPLSRAENLRVNGIYGLKKDLDLASWRLQVVGMRDEKQHPGYVADVTAWQYRYHDPGAHDDVGHDTKVDPAKAGRSAVPAGHDPDDGVHTAMKMAPASMLGKAMQDEEKSAPSEQDENGTGRGPRGLEEAGESDSTLPPNTPGVLLQLSDITRLPRHELVTQFKCIEGWSQIVHWAGVRMSDFLDAYPPAAIDGKEPRYAYMETPDGDYYVGYDLAVLRHPQTLLVTEMMGEPLTQKHGAPLRLHTPTKYGYKQIKRIGLIAYGNDRPDDYWTRLGYDWYAGL